MRISGTPGLASIVTGTPLADTPATASPPAAATASPAFESSTLQPALTALRALPDIDHAKVAALKVALARGELPFDAAKLAGLIERFHGSGSSGTAGKTGDQTANATGSD